MSLAEALTLRPDHDGSGGIARWALAGAVILAAHAGVWLVLQKAPPATGVETPPAIEMDLVPPPSGEAQTLDAGSTATSEASEQQVANETPDDAKPDETEPEMLPELSTDEPPPPPDEPIVTAEEPQETVQPEDVPTELVEIPPDVTPEVALPPEETVTAIEETPEPKREARRPEPKPVTPRKPVKETPRREEARKPPVQRRDATASAQQQAGGASGSSSNSGAARAAIMEYGRRLNALIAAQKSYPAGAQGASGRAVISFTVNRSGRVVQQSITSSSGNAVLDAELQSMLRRASSSFPPMPAEIRNATQRFTNGMVFTRR